MRRWTMRITVTQRWRHDALVRISGGLKRETPGALTPGVPVTISLWRKVRFVFCQPPDCFVEPTACFRPNLCFFR
jgi:hypothetical protein